MPNYFTLIQKQDDEEIFVTNEKHATGQEAKARANKLNADMRSVGLTTRYIVRQITSDMHAWRDRERDLFKTGYYKTVPWDNESWFRDSIYADTHFTHISKSDPTKVAFIRSEADGIASLKLRMNPGRYLTRYFIDVIGQSGVRKWTNNFDILHEKNTVLFAATEDEIQSVYLNGPSSCMSHTPESFDSPFHPTRVYAAGDLQVAYLVRDDRITARCVVWPEKKEMSIVYGDIRRLYNLLVAQGYKRAKSFCGARLIRHKIKEDNQTFAFVAPYLDEPHQGVVDDGTNLIISSIHQIECKNTHGLSESVTICLRCQHHSLPNEDFQWITDLEVLWCPECTVNHATACNCCRWIHSEQHTHYKDINGGYVCQRCTNSYYARCSECRVVERKGAFTAPNITFSDQFGRLLCASCLTKTQQNAEENAP